MRESVLTKKPNVSVMKPMRQMEVIPFYEERLDMEMMEVLRTMQSPVDERRRVQQRVVDKHRYDSERRYWMERDSQDNGRRFLRKSMSLNDIHYSGRFPKSYLEIHQQQMDNARNESVPNSRANSSQDAYQFRQYPRGDVNSSRSSMVHHGSLPSSRLSMANMPGENLRRETPNRYDSSQFTTRPENNNSYIPVNDSRSYSSQGPAYQDVYRNPNFSKVNDMNVSRTEKGEARKMSLPLPNIKPGQGGERIMVTMSPGQPDRVSIRMAQVPGIPSPSSKSSAPSPSNQSSNKVQYKSSLTNGQSRATSSRQEGPPSSNSSSSNSHSKNSSTVNVEKSHHNTKMEKNHQNAPKMEKNHQNAPKMEKTIQNTPKIEKNVKRNTVKNESVEKADKPASSHKRVSHTERSASSTRSNQPEWYKSIDSDGTLNTKDVERKSSLTTTSVAKTDKKVVATQNQTRVQNTKTQQDRTKGIRKTIKEKKPQQSSLRKTNSFKVVGRSTNFFGFVSVADIRAKKKVTFSNTDSERPGTA